MSPVDDTVSVTGHATQATGTIKTEEIPPLQPGTQVGRYMIIDHIGKGGMGMVYKAFDPDLNRPVALKLLTIKKDLDGDERDLSRYRIRLLREAQALAQLSHPNVITVYDVGTYDDAIFMAMELVEGQTLKEWLEQGPHPRDKIMEVVMAAGHGLDAAHQAGIIHRDFKPANVIIGQSGRVRVLDFGLARATGPIHSKAEDARIAAVREAAAKAKDRGSSSSASLASTSLLTGELGSAELDSSVSVLSTSLTQEGSVVGTPRYMAPEQHMEEPVEERSDQFSFCIVLFEALFGERPFKGKTYTEMVFNVVRRRIVRPDNADVPAWLEQVIRRGLSIEPEDRYASMGALLADLANDPAIARKKIRARRLRILSVVGFVLLAALAVFGVSYGMTRGFRLCQGAQDRISEAWSPEIQQNIRKRFLASARPYAEDTFLRIVPKLERRASLWVSMRTDACEATHVRGEQSEQLLDRRMQCLDRRLSEMRALTDLFATQTDDEVVDKAVEAVSGLARLAACADVEALGTRMPLPEDPKLRAKIRQLRVRLDEADALEKAGKFRAGLPIAQAVAEKAARISYLPLQGEAFYRLASLQKETGNAQAAEKSFQTAAEMAARSKDDWLRAQTSTKLVHLIGYQMARHAEALTVGRLAQDDITRAGSDPGLRAKVLYSLGVILSVQGHYQKAEDTFRQALAIAEEAFGPDHPAMTNPLNGLGHTMYRQEKYIEARKLMGHVLAIMKKEFGPDHPSVARGLNNLGLVLNSMGAFTPAQEHFEQALSIWERSLGAQHPRVANALNNLGESLLLQKQYAKAETLFRRALRIREASLGIAHPKLATPLGGLADLLRIQGRYREAQPLYQRAANILETAYGADSHQILGPITGWSACLVDGHKTPEALALLERVRKQREAKSTIPSQRASTQFVLARALWANRREQTRALDLAEQARSIFRTGGRRWQQELSRVENWLSRHHLPAAKPDPSKTSQNLP